MHRRASLAIAELLARVENTFGISLERDLLATVSSPRDFWLLCAGHRGKVRPDRSPYARTYPSRSIEFLMTP
ncbi:MAG: hypothetical protein ACRDTH_03095 [Pseudonocardiaceae bacterium]